MPRTAQTDIHLDLTNKGAYADVPTLGLDSLSVNPTNIAGWGTTAIVELKKVVGGVAESFSSAKVLQAGTANLSHRDIATETAEALRLEVTTPDSSARVAKIRVAGEGKD